MRVQILTFSDFRNVTYNLKVFKYNWRGIEIIWTNFVRNELLHSQERKENPTHNLRKKD
jgi:hypothetical protein